MNGSLPAAARIGRIALSVESLDETVAFYRDVVGLTVRSRADRSASLGTPETSLLVLSADPALQDRPADAAGLFHLAVRVPSREALGAALERVRDRWHLAGASDHLVSEALYLSDPEGNGVEIYCDRPQTDWPTTADGRVEMTTDPLDLADLARLSSGGASVPEGTDIGHVHLEVTALPAAREFYAETLGLDVRQQMRGALFLAAGDYHHHVGCNTWNRRSAPAAGRGLSWFEIVVPDSDALEATRKRFKTADIDVTTDGAAALGPLDDESTIRSQTRFAVTDPDGITIQIRALDHP